MQLAQQEVARAVTYVRSFEAFQLSSDLASSDPPRPIPRSRTDLVPLKGGYRRLITDAERLGAGIRVKTNDRFSYLMTHARIAQRHSHHR